MKRVILTLRIGHYKEDLFDVCTATHKKYALQYGIDYIVLGKKKIVIKDEEQKKLDYKAMVYLQKTQILRYNQMYDQVLYIDGDVLITPQAPNIFEVYPELDVYRAYQQLGIYEKATIAYSQKYGIPWERRFGQFIYYNGGVQLLGKDCNLDNDIKDYMVTAGHDESFTGYVLQKNHVKNETLPAEWNKMDFDITIPDRRKAYFIHYAGTGYTGIEGKSNRLECEKEKFKIAVEDYQYFYNIHHEWV